MSRSALSDKASRRAPRDHRAMQFAPFASLRGYYDLLNRRRREREPRRELSEDEAAALSRKMNRVRRGMMLQVRYYCASLGAYETLRGMVAKYDPQDRRLTIVKTTISMDDIISVASPDLPDEEEY